MPMLTREDVYRVSGAKPTDASGEWADIFLAARTRQKIEEVRLEFRAGFRWRRALFWEGPIAGGLLAGIFLLRG